MKVISQVKILLRNGQKYLLLQKKRDIHIDHIGGWEVPGGKVKKGEEVILAVHREVKEETGLGCRILKELKPLRLEKEGIITITRVFLGETVGAEVGLSSEHTAFRWVLPSEIEKIEKVIYKELLMKYLEEAEKK